MENGNYGIFADDKEYLEEYFNVCEVLSRKRALLLKFDESEYRRRRPLSPEDKRRLNEKIAELNGRIREMDEAFWDKAQKSVDAGKKFAAEEMSEHYGLDLFERKVLLFFLYLEFCQIGKNVCSEDELLGIFDLEPSVIFRMKNMRHFNHDMPLLKNQVIYRDFKRVMASAKAEYALSNKAIGIFSRLVSGEAVEWGPADALDQDASFDNVGCVKTPECTLNDIVLKSEIKEKITLFLDAFRDSTFEKLGVAGKIKKGTGLNFLFYGPPGTGKSMLAEAIAAYLGKRILIVEASKIMDRWVGATDKNISSIFRQAKQGDFVVILDEADSLLYSRSYADHEHDIRFVNVMLQELERYQGVIVLTTNMDILLDQALERRLALKVQFEAPDKKMLADIWKVHIPGNVALAGDVDFNELARRYDFTGGNIKNAILNSMRRIGSRKDNNLTMEDLIFGADLEKEGMFTKKKDRSIKGFSVK
jgi:AAA+ superfamily predicted ATPase